jgi:hypothetical protein
MKGKITLLVGGAVGYVLGTRAGRERYEQIKSQAQSLWNDPRVQEKAAQAQDLAKEKAPVLKDKVTDKVTGDSTGGDSTGTGSAGVGPTGADHLAGGSDLHGDAGDSAAYPTTATTGLS